MKVSKNKTVFVLDGRSRAALQIVRSLGKKGFRIIVGNDRRICSSFFSKYSRKNVVYPDPDTNEFKEFIFSFLKKNKVDFLIPVRDSTTVFCSKYKGELSEYTKLLICPYETLIKGRDKSETMKFAERIGIPCPKTFTVLNEYDLLSRSYDFPIILKPAFSSGSRGLFKINNIVELKRISKTIFNDYDKYLVQEYIPGNETIGVNVIFSEQSDLKALFTYKRLREFPRNGGPSVLRESVYHEEVKRLGKKLFSELQWKGVAMAEFKIDIRDSIPKLMEINPRFWGSLALPIFAGIDFPDLLCEILQGNEVNEQEKYKVGVKARWLLLGDILWILTSKNLLSDLKVFFVFFGKDLTYDIVSFSDPFPSIGAIFEGFISIFSKKRRAHALKRGDKIK